jgi:predicted acylesterase/phospholipase RssA
MRAPLVAIMGVSACEASSNICQHRWAERPPALTSNPLAAIRVRTGRGHVFRKGDLTPDVLLASACLPTLFQAIEIDGEAYWDGGFAGNPTITPLIRECTSRDTILVPINPLERPGPPRGAREILDRVNEVSFNAVTLKERKMIPLIRERPKARSGPECAFTWLATRS